MPEGDIYDLFASQSEQSMPAVDMPPPMAMPEFPSDSGADIYNPMQEMQGGQTSQAEPSGIPGAVPRGFMPQDIPGNFLLDLKDLGPGMKTLGSLAGARFMEQMPWNGFQPMIRYAPMRLPDGRWIKSDWENAAEMAGLIGQEYKKNYVDPLLEGRPQDIAKYAAQHPFYAGSDALALLPAAKALGVGKLANKLPGAAKASAYAGMAGNTARDVANKAVSVAGFAGPQLARIDNAWAQTVGKTLQGIAAAVEQRKLTKGFEQAMLETTDKFTNELKPLYDAIDPKLRRPKGEAFNGVSEVQAFAEGWHPAQHSMPPAVTAYLTKANEFSNEMKHMLGPLLKPDVAENQRFAPAALRQFGKAAGYEKISGIPADVMQKYIRTLKKQGVDPTYSPWVRTSEVAATLNRSPGNLKAGIARSAEATAADKLEDVAEGFLKEKGGSGEGIHSSHYNALKTRWIQINQFIKAKEMLEQAFAQSGKETPAIKAAVASGQLAKFPLHKLTNKIVAVALPGLTEAETLSALKGMPQQVFVPPGIAKALAQLAGADARPDKLVSAINKSSSVVKRYLLGGNLAYPEQQMAQNLFTLQLVHHNGLRGTIATLAAYKMFLDKSARALIPEAIKGSSDLVDLGGKWLGPIEKYVDWNMERMQKYDAATRTLAGLKLAFEDAHQGKAISGMLKGMADTSQAIQDVAGTMKDPAKVNAVAKKVAQQLGDFSAKANDSQYLKLAFLWPAWYKYITKFTLSLPANHPYKNVLLTNIHRNASEVFGDKEASEWMRKAGAVRLVSSNDQGYDRSMIKGGLNPLSTVPDLIEIFASLGDPTGEAPLLGQAAPIPKLALTYMQKQDPATGRDFNDPNLVHVGGQQYTQEDAAQGVTEHPQHPTPPLLQYLWRNTFSQGARLSEDIYEHFASGGKPSQFSSILPPNSAPKRDAANEVIKADPLLPTILNRLMGLVPMTTDPQKEANRERFDLKTQKNLLRKAN